MFLTSLFNGKNQYKYKKKGHREMVNSKRSYFGDHRSKNVERMDEFLTLLGSSKLSDRDFSGGLVGSGLKKDFMAIYGHFKIIYISFENFSLNPESRFKKLLDIFFRTYRPPHSTPICNTVIN